MSGRRLPVLIILVAGLVAVVALVAHGRPLAASGGHGGVPLSFWNYVVTTAIILVALGVLFLIATLFSVRVPWRKPQRSPLAKSIRALAGLIVVGLVVKLVLGLFHDGLPHPAGGGGNGTEPTGGKPAAGTSGPHFIWLEALVVFGVLAVAVAIGSRHRWRKRESAPEFDVAPEAVAEALDEALDESLDDLRTDPDVRRAIVSAYARMENALRRVGLPRRPAEAPLEYLERALERLDTSGPSIRRLTDLFEWAKFSDHVPEPSMRDEAIEALEAVRDELRAPVEVRA